jgi:hypothetical protein
MQITPSPFSRVKIAVAAMAVLVLAACTSNFNANVSRFQSQLPAPQGQTFAVVADDPDLAGGLEFSQYAGLVEARLAQLGYTPASPERATLLVRFDYGVDKGRERIRSTGPTYDPFWGPWHGYGRFGYGPYRRGPWGYGWYDPWFDMGGSIDSYTVYTSGVSMRIDRKADNVRLFEGKAEAVSTSNRLQYLVPNLVEAMFTDFPGHSGDTVRISVAPERQTPRPR